MVSSSPNIFHAVEDKSLSLSSSDCRCAKPNSVTAPLRAKPRPSGAAGTG